MEFHIYVYLYYILLMLNYYCKYCTVVCKEPVTATLWNKSCRIIYSFGGLNNYSYLLISK